MSLFLVASIPLWLLLIVSFYKIPSRGWRGLFIPFLGGLVTGMGALSITLSVLTRTQFSMDFSRLFLWAWIRGPGMAGLIVAAAVTAVHFRRNTSYSRIRELSAWFGGTAFCYLLWLAVSPDPGFDGYRVLLAPFVWIGAFGSSVWLADRGLKSDGWGKNRFFSLCGPVPDNLYIYSGILCRGENFRRVAHRRIFCGRIRRYGAAGFAWPFRVSFLG